MSNLKMDDKTRVMSLVEISRSTTTFEKLMSGDKINKKDKTIVAVCPVARSPSRPTL